MHARLATFQNQDDSTFNDFTNSFLHLEKKRKWQN